MSALTNQATGPLEDPVAEKQRRLQVPISNPNGSSKRTFSFQTQVESQVTDFEIEIGFSKNVRY